VNTFLWILQIILCIKFVSVAYTHGFRRDKAEMQQAMGKLGPAAPLVLTLVTVVMFLSGVGLIAPAVSGSLAWLASWAAALLALMMLMSIGFHVASREKPMILADLILFALAAFVAYGRWFIVSL
jgi:hypothetical protein